MRAVEAILHLAPYALALAAGLIVVTLLRKEHVVLQSGAAATCVVLSGGVIAVADGNLVGCGLILISPLLMAVVTYLLPNEAGSL
jgi:hypothetical protein